MRRAPRRLPLQGLRSINDVARRKNHPNCELKRVACGKLTSCAGIHFLTRNSQSLRCASQADPRLAGAAMITANGPAGTHSGAALGQSGRGDGDPLRLPGGDPCAKRRATRDPDARLATTRRGPQLPPRRNSKGVRTPLNDAIAAILALHAAGKEA